MTRRFSVAAMGVLFSAFLLWAQVARAQTVVRFQANGTDGGVDFSGGQLTVARGGQGTNTTTFLFFSLTTFDTNGNILASYFGIGHIPSGTLQGDGTGSLTLNVDLSTAPDFALCTFIPNVSNTCTNAPQGVISLTWKRTLLLSAHTTETVVQSYPGVKFEMSGSSDTSSATIQGTILGTTLTNALAGIGTQHQTSIGVFIP